MMNGLQMLAWIADPWTYALVAIVALLLFGKRLPEVGRSLGRGIAEFKKGLRDVQDELNKESESPPRRELRPPPEDDASANRKFLSGESQPPTPPKESGADDQV